MYVGRTFWTINASCQEGVIGKAVFGATVPRATQSSKDSRQAFPGRCIESASGGLMDAFYAQLLRLAKGLEQADQFLPAILCYRALCEQILEEARSKAYGYASRYVAKLDALNLSIDGYADFPDHVAYMSRIRERHGRKHAFWRRLKGVE